MAANGERPRAQGGSRNRLSLSPSVSRGSNDGLESRLEADFSPAVLPHNANREGGILSELVRFGACGALIIA
jgi:hypothetical protein